MKKSRMRMNNAGWTMLALSVTILLSPLSGYAEEQSGNDMSRLKRDLQLLREETETKNAMMTRLQERLDALEHTMRSDIRRPAEEQLITLKQELRTEMVAKAEDRLWGGQVFFKGGHFRMDSPRRNSMLTTQDDPHDRDGWQVGAGVDLPVMKLFGNPLLGQIMVEYGQTQKTTGAAPPLAEKRGLENTLTLIIAPKYRIDTLGSRWPALASIRPWIIPVGLTFDVNTPVNTALTNVSVGGTTGVGAERLFWGNRLSAGVDFRYYWGPDIPDERLSRFTTGGYVGINF